METKDGTLRLAIDRSPNDPDAELVAIEADVLRIDSAVLIEIPGLGIVHFEMGDLLAISAPELQLSEYGQRLLRDERET